MDTLVTKLNTCKNIYNYWIFIYTYNPNDIPSKLSKDSIYVFSFSYYSLYKNRGLFVYTSDRQLDLSQDDDLELVLKKFRLNNIKSISELNINSNISIICFEVDYKKSKRFQRNDNLLFYTSKNEPSYYINRNEYIDEEYSIMVPNNYLSLNTKLKLHIPKVGLITTKVTLNRVFKFLFSSLFEEILNKKIDSDSEKKQDYFEEYRKNSKDSIGKLLESIKKINDSEEEEEEEEEDDEEGYDSDDSGLSWYSYCKKYGVPTKEKVID